MTKEDDKARRNEARDLAADAVEAAKHGNKDDAEFLMQEACEMDEVAATEVAEHAQNHNPAQPKRRDRPDGSV